MDGYKHYIRLDAENNIVIHRFSDAFETPLETDICVDTDAGRHYNDPYTNERGQLMYKWDGTQQVERSQSDLDTEWASRPPEPKPDSELLKEARQEIGRLNRSMDSLSADVQAIIDTIVV